MEVHAPSTSLTEVDTLDPDVLEFLLLQDGLIPFSPHGFCAVIDRLVPSWPSTVS